MQPSAPSYIVSDVTLWWLDWTSINLNHRILTDSMLRHPDQKNGIVYGVFTSNNRSIQTISIVDTRIVYGVQRGHVSHSQWVNRNRTIGVESRVDWLVVAIFNRLWTLVCLSIQPRPKRSYPSLTALKFAIQVKFQIPAFNTALASHHYWTST